jgi:hypothetical protein
VNDQLNKEGYVSVHKYLGEMPERTLSRARTALRQAIAKHDDFRFDASSANVVLEQVWNALVGNDKARER